MAAFAPPTFPLAFRLQSRVPLGAADLWQNLWNFWWWKTALFELGASPYWTAYLYHPDGVSLAFHTHSPLNVLATLPISLLFGVEAAYNCAILAGFWLAGFGTWLLARSLGIEPRAAFVAGLIYAFAPMHFEQSLEHLNLASVQFIPLVVYFVMRLLREGGRARVLGAGLCLAANALVCWQFGLLSLPIVAALALWQAWRSAPVRPRRLLVRDLSWAGALALALVLPFAWSLLLAAFAGGPTKPFENTASDPVFWLLPSDHNPVLGWLVRDVYAEVRLPPQIPTAAGRTSVPVYRMGGQVGYATSGCWSPLLKKYIVLAHLEEKSARLGTAVMIEVTAEHRRRRARARVVETPFFDPERKRS
jgi:hypothetical protein